MLEDQQPDQARLRDIYRRRLEMRAREPERDFAAVQCCAAWHDVNTCRSIGMAAGPIPFTAVVAWAEIHGLDREATLLLVDVIGYVDGQRARREQAKRDLEAAKGKNR